MESKAIFTPFETIPEAELWLKNLGYNYDFNIEHNCLSTCEVERLFSPEDFLIDYVFKFKSATDPNGEDFVYALSSDKLGIKGVMSSEYGQYADSVSNEIISHLVMRHV